LQPFTGVQFGNIFKIIVLIGRAALAVLDSIRVFMRVMELGSFSTAARSLRMSAAVVSYRMKVLEDHLGCRLFTRTTRRMSPTEAGRIFYERCVDVIESVERAEASVADAGAAPRGALKVTAPLGLGRRVIATMVADYHTQNPETQVWLRLSDHLIDIIQESVDVAIRMSQLKDSTMTLRKIADVERVLCASPAYIERKGSPKTPADLLRHVCLLLRFPGSQQFRWTLMEKKRAVTLPVSGPIDADDGDVLTEWTLAGQGIVLKPIFEIAEHLAAGRLVPVLRGYPPQPVILAALYPSRRMVPRRLTSFVDMAVERLRAHVRTQTSLWS
jgi:DNA-binding transcriptional LysR family regulator